MKVKLSDLIDAMDAQSDQVSAYLNKRSGVVVCLSDEELSWTEDDLSDEDGPEWMDELAEQTKEVLSSGDYLELPSQFDIHEYRIMESFCRSRADDRQAEELSRAIASRGAFRRFKDMIHHLGIHDEWYRYKELALRQIAVDWCEENDIAFSEE